MNILDALKGLTPPKPEHNERKMLDNGMLSISDAVFYVALWKGGVEQAIIDDLMLEPVENREQILKYRNCYAND